MAAQVARLLNPLAFVLGAIQQRPIPSPRLYPAEVPGVELRPAAGGEQFISVGGHGLRARNLGLFDALVFLYEGERPILDCGGLPAGGFDLVIEPRPGGDCWTLLAEACRRRFGAAIGPAEATLQVGVLRPLAAEGVPPAAGGERALPLGELKEILAAMLGCPVLDETGRPPSWRVALPGNWREPGRLAGALSEAGLVLERASRRLPVLAVGRSAA